MEDLILKTETEEEMREAIGFFAVDNNGEWIAASKSHALLVIGSMSANDAVIDPKTYTITKPATILDGFHANVLCTSSIRSKIASSAIISDAELPKNRRFKWSGI